jgi:hypothetical protein
MAKKKIEVKYVISDLEFRVKVEIERRLEPQVLMHLPAPSSLTKNFQL